LRFYLATKDKCTPDCFDNSNSNSITLNPIETIDHQHFSTITNILDEYPSKNDESNTLTSTTPPLVDDEYDAVLISWFETRGATINHESPNHNNYNFNAPATVTSESELFLPSNTSNEIISSITDNPRSPSTHVITTIENVPINSFPDINNIQNHNHLILHRGRIFQELLDAIEKIDKSCDSITIELILPNGLPENAIDAGGVLKDALSEFWSSFYETSTEGTTLKVPSLRHDFKILQWRTIAKIFYIGWKKVKYFPVKLVPSFFEQLLFGHTESDLIEVFLQTKCEADKHVLSNALKDFENVDLDEVLDILSDLGCRNIVNKNNFKKILEEIAHKELIQKPMFIIDCFAEELKEAAWEQPISIEILNNIYNNMKATSKNVLRLIKFEDSDLDFTQRTTLNFLKKYLKETKEDNVINFLRFCTGADMITDTKIKIQFTNTTGLLKTPIAHTCSSTLELPTEYESFIQFRSEMNNLFQSNIWVMDSILPLNYN